MPTRLNSIKEVAAVLKKIKDPVIVVAHRGPDGDAVGSSVGLIEILRKNGVDAVGMTPDPVPEYLRFLIKDIPWREPNLDELSGRIIITVDVSDRKLLAEVGEDDRKIALAIDHHISHEQTPFASQYYVDAHCASASQIVADIAKEIHGKMTPAAATAIYTGILTDTGCFKWGASNADFPALLRNAAWVAEQGVDVTVLTNRMVNTVKHSFVELCSLVMKKAEFLEDGKLVFVGLTEEDFVSVKATDEDKSMIASWLCSIEGVQIAALVSFKEGVVKASVRGRVPEYKVNVLAQVFGGGGHAGAAGIKNIKEPLEEFLPRFKKQLLLHWSSYGSTPRSL